MPDSTADLSDDESWEVIAESALLDQPRPVVPIDFKDQQWVLFRDEGGQLGMLSRHCPHRGADLCFARREDNGLRCPFHGWHFDRHGQCTEQPAEPEGSVMHTLIKVPTVEVVEHNGRVFAKADTSDLTKP